MSELPLPAGSENTSKEPLSSNADGAQPPGTEAGSVVPADARSRSRAGRNPVLDAVKRGRIVALVANGSSRRAAARFVGCSPSTITRTGQRDPQFGADLARAEHQVEVESLRAIRAAAKNERNWRAAAWLLEHLYPEDYAAHLPDRYTLPQILAMFVQVVGDLPHGLPSAPRAVAMEEFCTLLADLRNEETRNAEG